MFKIIRLIINVMLFALLNIILYFFITDITEVMYTLEVINIYMTQRPIQFLVVSLIMVYNLIIILSILEVLWKKKKTVKVPTNNGKIEISLSTIEDITKAFLEEKSIIKSAKANVETGIFGTNLNVVIENYKTNELNEKISKIKQELEEHIKEMLGFKVSKINFNINKINSEIAVENIKMAEVEEVVKLEDTKINID